jgi:hypothetical protein
MAAKSVFNPKLTMPIFDIIIALLLIVATGYFWFQTAGKERVAEGHEGLRSARAQNAADLASAEQNLADVEQELVETRAERDGKAAQVVWLEDQVELEQERITEYERLDQEYTDRLLDLRLEIQRVRDQRAAYNTDIYEAENDISGTNERIGDLVAQAQERNDELARLDSWIAQAEAELEANPPSRFPDRSSLASVVEITDPEERLVVSLARGLTRVGNLDVGLLGSLGLSRGAESSLKEGGLFANLLLMPRKASIDFEGGISQLSSRAEEKDDTGVFGAATLRYAPTRRERLFLLAGTRYSHEDIGLRLGLGFGRR